MTHIADIVEGVTLRSCPFCGSHADLKKQASDWSGDWYWAKCSNPDCGISTQSTPDPEKATKLWETRADHIFDSEGYCSRCQCGEYTE